MGATILVLALVAAAACVAAAAVPSLSETQQLFSFFVEKYEKVYQANRIFSAFNTFKSNLAYVNAHNAGNSTFSMAINEFGDLSAAEFAARMGLGKPLTERRPSRTLRNRHLRSVSTAALPKQVDLRDDGAVNPVANQSSCRSCHAFAAAAAYEAAVFFASGTLHKFSEGQITFCTGGRTCDRGGLMTEDFEYIKERGGLCTATDYPYVPKDAPCAEDSCKPPRGAQLDRIIELPEADEDALLAAASENVVAVGLAASTEWQFYSEGVFTGKCSRQLDHGVAIVGYDLKAKIPHYIVRNSWGAKWGEGGYIRMQQGTNLCGIADMASYVTV